MLTPGRRLILTEVAAVSSLTSSSSPTASATKHGSLRSLSVSLISQTVHTQLDDRPLNGHCFLQVQHVCRVDLKMDHDKVRWPAEALTFLGQHGH